MSELVATSLLWLLGGSLTYVVIRLTRGTFRLGWLKPLEDPLATIPMRRLRHVWDSRRWQLGDYGFFVLMAGPTCMLLDQASSFGPGSGRCLVAAAICLFLAAMAACDRRFTCMPPPILQLALGIGLSLSVTELGIVTPGMSIVGALFGLLLTGVPGLVYLNTARKISLGPSDPWLAAAIGSFTGPLLVSMVLSASLPIYLASALVATSATGAARLQQHLAKPFAYGVPLALAGSYAILTEVKAPGALAAVIALIHASVLSTF